MSGKHAMNQVWNTKIVSLLVLTLAFNAHVVDKTTQQLEVIHDLAAKMAGKLDEFRSSTGLHLKLATFSMLISNWWKVIQELIIFHARLISKLYSIFSQKFQVSAEKRLKNRFSKIPLAVVYVKSNRISQLFVGYFIWKVV